MEVLRCEVDVHGVWQELQRDVHKQQLLIDEELTQSIDGIKANAATGAGNTIRPPHSF